MGRCYSQDLRDRVIDAVAGEGMSCRAAARRCGVSDSSAIKWLRRYRKTGRRAPVGTGGHRPSVLAPHRDFLQAARAEKPDITLAELCARLAAECGVKADTGMLSRFFRREGITVKKRHLPHRSATARTSAAGAPNGASIRAASTLPAWCLSMRPGPKPT